MFTHLKLWQQIACWNDNFLFTVVLRTYIGMGVNFAETFDFNEVTVVVAYN